jgi:hypothetical protein
MAFPFTRFSFFILALAQDHSLLALVVSYVLPILLAKLVKRELRRHASVSQFERSLILYNANV